MIFLVLAGEAIVATSPTIETTADAVVTPDGVYPFRAGVTGTASVASLPADFSPALYVWQGGALVRLPDPPVPPGPVPEAITPLQARRSLRAADLLDAVTAWIVTQPAEAQEAWEYCIEVRRDSPLIAAAQVALGMTDEQVDDLFRAGAEL
jgi:hypothetical protein